ncbi:MAG: CHAD domain-containing protein [Acidimicrobiia bacterium]
MRTVTFLISGDEARTVIESLAELGFVFEPSRAVTTTVLDTFDGRLHRARLRLELHESDGLELVLSGDETVPARLAVTGAPRFPTDLPPGPFRARLAALVDVRALLPQISVTAERTTAAWRDASDKVVATAQLDEQIRVVDPAGADGPAATVEIHEVTGYAKRARRAVDVLDRLGLPKCETDTVSACATAADVDLGGYAATATVPLDPQMPAVDGYRAVLTNLATAITANWEGTIDQSDTEFLHDLRIAVRRTRTVLGEAKAVVPAGVRTPARAGFAWLAGLTGPARDLDAYLLEWDRYTGPLGSEVVASLAPVRALLEQRRADAHTDLERALRSQQAADLMSTWTAWLGRPLDREYCDVRAERPLGRLVAKRMARAHSIVVEHGRLIDPDTPAQQVHDLRKDAKKLRYLLECFGSLLPDRPRKRFVKRLKALQDNLGEHQDAEVHVAMLRAIAHELHGAGASSDTMVAIGQLTERLDQHRLAARAEFADRFADFDTKATQGALDAMLEGILR